MDSCLVHPIPTDFRLHLTWKLGWRSRARWIQIQAIAAFQIVGADQQPLRIIGFSFQIVEADILIGHCTGQS